MSVKKVCFPSGLSPWISVHLDLTLKWPKFLHCFKKWICARLASIHFMNQWFSYYNQRNELQIYFPWNNKLSVIWRPFKGYHFHILQHDFQYNLYTKFQLKHSHKFVQTLNALISNAHSHTARFKANTRRDVTPVCQGSVSPAGIAGSMHQAGSDAAMPVFTTGLPLNLGGTTTPHAGEHFQISPRYTDSHIYFHILLQ